MKISWKSIFGLFASILTLLLFTGVTGFDIGVLDAKITQETNVVDTESVVFDQHNPIIKKVMEVQNRHTPKLIGKRNIVGTATGLTDDNKPAIVVFTKKKLKPGAIPESIEGIPVITHVTGEFLAMKDSSKSKVSRLTPTSVWPRPVPIGISTGNAGECSAGTIGARVTAGSNVYALSNNHVYALENTASTDPASRNSEVLQPGLYDTNCVYNPKNVIGNLADYVPIMFNNTSCDPNTNPSACNIVDAAIAVTTKGNLGNTTPANGYGTPNSTTYLKSSPKASLRIGLPVQKYGRTTSLTKGTVTEINATINVSYGPGKNAIFTNQIVIGSTRVFLKAGDSGSLVVTDDPGRQYYPVGLLFAGSSSGKSAIANPIDPVLSELGVSIDGK